MKKNYLRFTPKRIVVVSLFSGADLFLLGMIKAGMVSGYAVERNFWAALMHSNNFKHRDGKPVINFVNNPVEEYQKLKADDATSDTVGIIDGQHVRTISIQEVNGYEIRAELERRFGKDIIIVVIGGPPCQDFTSLNQSRDTGETGRNNLVFEFLRILRELSEGDGNTNVIGVMEEVTEFGSKKFSEVYSKFIAQASQLPFHFAEQDMCALHYGGNQMRWRKVFQFIHKGYNTFPVFPAPDTINVKRVKDFLPHVEHFHSGHFNDAVKTKNHFMCTVTSGSPTYLEAAGKKWPPNFDELLLCMDVEKGEYLIPEGIPVHQVKKAIGNGVCVSMAYALATTLIDTVLKLKHIGDGYFIPKDSDNEPEDAVSGATPVEPSPDEDNTTTALTNEVGSAEVVPDTVIAPEVIAPTKDAIKESIQPVKYYERGFEIWRGKSQLTGEPIVAILTLHSQNEKTGDMAQLWILRADMTPLDALQLKKDDAICGSCKLRHSLDGSCYVRVGESPRTVWKAWKKEGYTKLRPEHYPKELLGLSLRITAYGDPAAIPVSVLQELKKHVTNHTGYTHQWRSESAQELKSLCMASVENEDEYREAVAKGWRTFRILAPGESLLPGEITCPNKTRGIQCIECKRCRGTSRKGKNIAIPVHGSKKNKFRRAVTTPENSETKPLLPHHPVIVVNNQIDNNEPPKFMSSESLLQMDFDCLNFENEWNHLFGLPSSDFHCIIHGKSGHGKSNFAIQLAKYLADNFGKVLYVSGEEGISATFQNKFIINDASSASLTVADLRNYDEFMTKVPQDSYNFIFLDSLNTMQIDAVKLRQIKAFHKKSALITISQATKAGDIRGSYDIVHDGDIVVEVVDGIATTTKNRFKVTGMKVNVFRNTKLAEQQNEEAPRGEKKVAKRFTREMQIELHTKQLNKALEVEDYELAAKLRDKINKIRNHP